VLESNGMSKNFVIYLNTLFQDNHEPSVPKLGIN